MSGILKGYFESKGAIEDLVCSAGFMHWTILRPNYLPPSVRGYFPKLGGSYTLRTAMAPEKRMMPLHPDDIGCFAVAALVEPERFSHRAIEIGEALTAEQVARAISEVSGREIAIEHIPRNVAECLAPSNPQIDSQLWFWELQDGIEPREPEAEFGFKLTTSKEFLTANQELVRETFG
ncbi:hypothetical protein N7536_003676 [Penicillium majusculum]|uniref:NmrA-like domain-containing protein n=1 Tax=Penicillium solitum TaxID=60172 RepID=A0A1V6RKB3_9EURO|nr:uncharacterized protein PENSOL_c003G01940 [Penicillium solitum]KAJ5700663.1 hypothetical protein N7536_003676 [Penicillium majusculum]OQE01968.1 hypothetical protein PENSOL_c003G01940 [Penicillium solitum]